MKIGLFFGSFNPIHVGHLIIANYIADYGDVDKVWLVVSPQNPFKNKTSLLADYHRLTMVDLAIENNDKLKSCNIEFGMQQPNYTVLTLAKLKEKYPEHQFSLIVGEDNLATFHKWYNFEQIVDNYPIIVYPRPYVKSENDFLDSTKYPNITLLKNTPLMEISSSMIRKAIKQRKNVNYLLTEPVLKYVEEMNFYK